MHTLPNIRQMDTTNAKPASSAHTQICLQCKVSWEDLHDGFPTPAACVSALCAGPLPASWSNLTQLSDLHITNAPLVTGPVPAEWGAGLKQLQRLELSNMSLTGPLDSLRNMSSLTSLALRFLPGLILPSGGLPALVSNTSLTELTFANVSGWSGLPLDANIPVSYPNISRLGLMGLGLAGTIPTSWQGFRAQQLRNLYLSFNALNGTLPSWLASKVARGFSLDLGSNNFTGGRCMSNGRSANLSSNSSACSFAWTPRARGLQPVPHIPSLTAVGCMCQVAVLQQVWCRACDKRVYLVFDHLAQAH
jgi:hypothetical protein